MPIIKAAPATLPSGPALNREESQIQSCRAAPLLMSPGPMRMLNRIGGMFRKLPPSSRCGLHKLLRAAWFHGFIGLAALRKIPAGVKLGIPSLIGSQIMKPISGIEVRSPIWQFCILSARSRFIPDRNLGGPDIAAAQLITPRDSITRCSKDDSSLTSFM